MTGERECPHGVPVDTCADCDTDSLVPPLVASIALVRERDALVAENKRLATELHVVAEAIWQNVNRADMVHWAQGIRVSIQGDGPPKFTDTTRDALVAALEVARTKLRETLAQKYSTVEFVERAFPVFGQIDAALKAAKGQS